MADWRPQLYGLAALGKTERFPLLVYKVKPPSQTPWPALLAAPSEAVREFYKICNGGYLGGHHNWLSLEELVVENQRWWDLQVEFGGPLDSNRHVILAYETSGFPLVWDQETDQLITYFYRGDNELGSNGPTINDFLSEIFNDSFHDDMWQTALHQFRELTGLSSDAPTPPSV